MKKLRNRYNGIIIAVLLLSMFSCGNNYVPKPRGYIRFDLPEHHYQIIQDNCPYTFEIGTYAQIENLNTKEFCWKNVYVKPCRAKVHISYKPIKNNIASLIEDAHEMVYNHTVKADAIQEQVFFNPQKHVYGILYEIKGDAASNIQFIATDSTHHFLRGALYFHAAPNEDSLAPLIKFMRTDIEHLIETLNWR